ncbi:transposase [Virgibacillus soli]
MLDIQDKNIYISENAVTYGQHKGKDCKFIKAKLTYEVNECPNCQAEKVGASIYKNGTQLSRITIPTMGVYPTYLLLKKQRFMCKHCDTSFTAQTNISYTEYKYYGLFGQRLESSVVQEILDYSGELRVNYDLYQDLLEAIDEKDYHALENALSKQCPTDASTYLRTSMKTLRKHLPYTKNSFQYTYNNSRIEGINNKIKVLNRVAYGYRNFNHYKNRIRIHFKLKPLVKTPNTSDKNKSHSRAA